MEVLQPVIQGGLQLLHASLRDHDRAVLAGLLGARLGLGLEEARSCWSRRAVQ